MVICQYGNCQEEVHSKGPFKLTVTESRGGVVWERPVFCCYEHAWRWLKERDERLNGRRDLHGQRPHQDELT